MDAVGVVFSSGGRVYSFNPDGLELGWNERVVCQTAHGQELGRVVKANHALGEAPKTPLKKVLRRATEVDRERAAANREEAKRAMRLFRELLQRHELDVKPVAAEIAFDGARAVFSYQSESRRSTGKLQSELASRLGKRVELRSVGPRECARLCGDVGLCGGKMCSRRYPSHEQPITLRMAKDQDLPVASGRITGLCGRLRCCLAFEHPTYKSFRDRAPRVGRRVETPAGEGQVTGYTVLEDTGAVLLDGEERPEDFPIDECRELAEPAGDGKRAKR
jgi:cell fate regulator YaaT (PSP1 superfamily)